MRRNVIILLTFIGGIFFFWEFIFPGESGISRLVPKWGKIELVITTFPFLLGMINLLKLHITKVAKRQRGYYNSAALIAALFVMLAAQVITFHVKEPTVIRESFEAVKKVLFDAVYQGLSATVFSLLAFYMASSAYRAFRVKSTEAGIMMFVAVIVMLGQVPMGTEMTKAAYNGFSLFPDWLRFEELRTWIMEVWNSAAQRGIIFGIEIGAVAMTLRIWLSLEKGSFFEDMK